MSLLAHPPQVVGTIGPQGLAALSELSVADRLVDIVEARFDLGVAEQAARPSDVAEIAKLRSFIPACARLEQSGTPVLATIRLAADGGRWTNDGARLPWFDDLLSVVSWVDIEVDSAIAPDVVALARARGRKVIVSHHDFSGTPPPEALEALVARGEALKPDVVKIASLVSTLDDHHRLIDLLHGRDLLRGRGTAGGTDLAVIGMGGVGTPLRSYLPCIGSRLTYGYLDVGVAPGQLSARELVHRLIADCPTYAEWRRQQGRL